MKNEKTIVMELKSLSTEYVKHYLLSDGSHRAVAYLKPQKENTPKIVNEDEVNHDSIFKIWELTKGMITTKQKAEVCSESSESSEPSVYVRLSIDLSSISKIGVIIDLSLQFPVALELGECEIYELKSSENVLGNRITRVSSETGGIANLNKIIQSSQFKAAEFVIKSRASQIMKLITTDAQNEQGLALSLDYEPADELLMGQKYYECQLDSVSCNINILTCVPYITVPLFNLGGEKFPLSLSLHYDGLKPTEYYRGKDTGLGKGWYTNFHQSCHYEEDGFYVYVDANRIHHKFLRAINSDTLWVDSQGTGLLLEKEIGKIKIYDENGNYFLFDNDGRLTEISVQQTDSLRFTNTITYERSARIKTITDGMGRVVSFAYDDPYPHTHISLDGIRKVVLRQFTDGPFLHSVTKLDATGANTQTYFRLNLANVISEVHAADGNKMELKYFASSSGFRISSFYDSKSHLKQRFDYRNLLTNITSNKGVTWAYQFNDRGEYLISYETKIHGDFNPHFVDRDAVQHYSGTLSYKRDVEFRFKDEEGHKLSETKIVNPGYMGINKTSEEYKTSIASTQTFAVFSGSCYTDDGETYELPVPEVEARLYDGEGNVLCSLEFSPIIRGRQMAAKVFTLKNTGGNYENLHVIVNVYSKGTYILSDFLITPTTSGVETLCANLYTGFNSNYFFQNMPLYYLKNNTSIETGNQKYSYVLHTADYLANERNFYTKKGTTWNMWVDNRRQLIANVENPIIRYHNNVELRFSELPRFVRLSIDNYIMNGVMQTHNSNEQLEYLPGKKSFMQRILVSYTKEDDKATANFTQHIFYDKYGRILKIEDSKRFTTPEYSTEGYLTSVSSLDILGQQDTYEELIYKDNYLKAIGSYIGDTIAYTVYNYDEMGNVVSVTKPNHFETHYTYYSYGENLQKVDATINRQTSENKISYKDGKVSAFSNSKADTSPIYLSSYSFTYNSDNELDTILVNGAVYAEFTYKYPDKDPNQDSDEKIDDKTYVTVHYGNANLPNEEPVLEKQTYDKYNRLITLAYEDQYVNYVYNDKKTFAITPDSPELEVSAQSKLYVIYDQFVDGATYYSYNEYDNLSTTQIDTSGRYHPRGTFYHHYGYDKRQRVNYEDYYFEPINNDNKPQISYTYVTGNNADQYEIKTVTVQLGTSYIQYDSKKDGLGRLQDEYIRLRTLPTGLTKSYSYATRKSSNEFFQGTTNYISKETFYKQGLFPNDITEVNSISYDYDINSNVTSVTKGRKEVRYIYDEANRLIREDNPFLGTSFTFSYDVAGNILSRSGGDYTLGDIDYKYHNNFSYGSSLAKTDKLLGINGINNFMYDPCGNPVLFKGLELTWTRGRLLESYKTEDKKIQFFYSGNGIRKFKYISNQNGDTPGVWEYVEDNGRLLIERYANDAEDPIFSEKKYFYGPNGIIGAYIKNRMYYYVKNMFGDVIQIWDAANNTLVASYEYDAWGNHKVYGADGNENTDEDFIGNQNPFRYRGYYWDNDLKMYYLKTRWYDPEICRFINMDMISYADPETINGLNLYAYCLNNPVMGYDPNGTSVALQFFISAFFYVGYAIGAIFDKEIREDMNRIGWNPFNSSETDVLDSSKVSFYKGVPVVLINDMGGSMSLGAIFFDKDDGSEVLKHERGHNDQLMMLGLPQFLVTIGLPSVLENDDNTPWELSASILGGSNLADKASPKQKINALKYLALNSVPDILGIFLLIYLSSM